MKEAGSRPCACFFIWRIFAAMRFSLVQKKIVLEETEIIVFVPDESQVKEAYQKGEIEFPYWSQVWPAAIALAQFLLQHPEYTLGKNVLEIGAGLGLPSLVAAQTAATVLCTDHAPDAVAIAHASAQRLQLQNFRSVVLDWNTFPNDVTADVLLLSDINYEPAALATLLALTKRFLENNAVVMLSTPQRMMAKEFILSLLPFCVRHKEAVVHHNGQEVSVSLLVLLK